MDLLQIDFDLKAKLQSSEMNQTEAKPADTNQPKKKRRRSSGNVNSKKS